MRTQALRFLSLCLPWPLRRRFLQRFFGYSLHPTSKIGLSWVFPTKSLVLEEHAKVGHLTVCHHLEDVRVGAHGAIGPLNWIGAYRSPTPLLGADDDRRSELVIGDHAGITMRHYIDCTDSIRIGSFTVLAGCRSVLLTHSVDMLAGRQSCAPITIGSYCFVGTNCVVLAGSALPDRSILGAMSLLNRELPTPNRVYAGSPAREIGTLDERARFLNRTTRRVDCPGVPCEPS